MLAIQLAICKELEIEYAKLEEQYKSRRGKCVKLTRVNKKDRSF